MKNHKWDIYFLKIAREVSKNSKCLSRQIGAVLVRDKSIISTGYNGPARGVTHCNKRFIGFYCKLDKGKVYMKDVEYSTPEECPRKVLGYKSGQGLHLCQAGHAERNALINAARNGISTKGTTLYCWCPMPCKDCAIEIVNAGVNIVTCLHGIEYDEYAKIILLEGGITINKTMDIALDEIRRSVWKK